MWDLSTFHTEPSWLRNFVILEIRWKKLETMKVRQCHIPIFPALADDLRVVVVFCHATSPQRWADYAVEHSAVSWLSVMAWEGQSPVRNRAGPSVPVELIACLETRREHKVSGEIYLYLWIWEKRAFQLKSCCWLMVQFNFPTKGQTNSWIMEEMSSDKRCLEKKR